uniref:Uncharacterized protein n=1 Tax=Arion vulgaris TaxID=1028688 RepID=A0A0B6YGR3_9EUPU
MYSGQGAKLCTSCHHRYNEINTYNRGVDNYGRIQAMREYRDMKVLTHAEKFLFMPS